MYESSLKTTTVSTLITEKAPCIYCGIYLMCIKLINVCEIGSDCVSEI